MRWRKRKGSKLPFSVMYPKAEKISRLMEAISNCEHFVMAGSMDSFHEHFDQFFELVVHLHAILDLEDVRYNNMKCG